MIRKRSTPIQTQRFMTCCCRLRPEHLRTPCLGNTVPPTPRPTDDVRGVAVCSAIQLSLSPSAGGPNSYADAVVTNSLDVYYLRNGKHSAHKLLAGLSFGKQNALLTSSLVDLRKPIYETPTVRADGR